MEQRLPLDKETIIKSVQKTGRLVIVHDDTLTGGWAEGYAFDITDSSQVEQNTAQIEQEVGPVDILVNNAGMHRRNPLEKLTDEDWKAVIDLNLSAAFVVARHVAKGMIKRNKGKIINITSLMAEDPEFDAWVKKKVPVGRWGDPSELIGTAIFLASKASDYVNGQTIYVDGGWLAAL